MLLDTKHRSKESFKLRKVFMGQRIGINPDEILAENAMTTTHMTRVYASLIKKHKHANSFLSCCNWTSEIM
jgi:hypothetical protein